MSEPGLYPLFLKLAGRSVLVVGGGPVALEKTRALLHSGAEVRVVAPEVVADLAALPVAIEQREFRPTDVGGAFVIIAAATPAVNGEVLRAGTAEHRFVVAVDDPDSCTAYGAAVLVNLLGTEGGAQPVNIPALLRIPGVSVHLYGKKPRPRRKIGHVVVRGNGANHTRSRAYDAMRLLGLGSTLSIP